MTHEAEESLIRQRVSLQIIKTGLAFDRVDIHSDKIVIISANDITFDQLATLSILFDTRKINIDCDLGCDSDRFHDTCITITDVRKVVESLAVITAQKDTESKRLFKEKELTRQNARKKICHRCKQLRIPYRNTSMCRRCRRGPGDRKPGPED